MRFIAKVVPLAEAVASASKIVLDNTGMPVLTCVLVESRDGLVIISSTDTETTIEHRVPAAVSAHGRICVPAKLFAAYLHQLPETELEFVGQGERVDVKCGLSQVEFIALDPETFPTMPLGTTRRLRDLQGSRIAQSIGATIFAAAKGDGGPPALHGAHVRLGEAGLTLTTTDGYRLARYTHGPIGDPADLVAPVAGLQAIARAFKDSPAVTLSTKSVKDSEHHFIADDGCSTVTTRLINAEFPDVSRLVATASTMSIVVERENIQLALKRAGLMADDHAKSLSLQIKADECEIRVESLSRGMGHEIISVAQDGSSLDITVNAQFFVEILNHIESDSVRISFDGPFAPISIGANGGPGVVPDALYLLMPLKAKAASGMQQAS